MFTDFAKEHIQIIKQRMLHVFFVIVVIISILFTIFN